MYTEWDSSYPSDLDDPHLDETVAADNAVPSLEYADTSLVHAEIDANSGLAAEMVRSDPLAESPEPVDSSLAEPERQASPIADAHELGGTLPVIARNRQSAALLTGAGVELPPKQPPAMAAVAPREVADNEPVSGMAALAGAAVSLAGVEEPGGAVPVPLPYESGELSTTGSCPSSAGEPAKERGLAASDEQSDPGDSGAQKTDKPEVDDVEAVNEAGTFETMEAFIDSLPEEPSAEALTNALQRVRDGVLAEAAQTAATEEAEPAPLEVKKLPSWSDKVVDWLSRNTLGPGTIDRDADYPSPARESVENAHDSWVRGLPDDHMLATGQGPFEPSPNTVYVRTIDGLRQLLRATRDLGIHHYTDEQLEDKFITHEAGHTKVLLRAKPDATHMYSLMVGIGGQGEWVLTATTETKAIMPKVAIAAMNIYPRGYSEHDLSIVIDQLGYAGADDVVPHILAYNATHEDQVPLPEWHTGDPGKPAD
jgi:hypothetical protein